MGILGGIRKNVEITSITLGLVIITTACGNGLRSGSGSNSSFALTSPNPPEIAVTMGFAGSSNIPNPPLAANHAASIQKLNSWIPQTGAVSQCPNGSPAGCAFTNANFNPVVAHPVDPTPLTGSDGVAGEFQFYDGPAWSTALWGRALLTNMNARHFVYDFYVYTNAANYEAMEVDIYTSLNGGQRYMMGSQCNRGKNSWDTWNSITQAWVRNAIPCNTILTANAWHHVTFYNTADSMTNTYTYVVIRVDGTDYVLNQRQPANQADWKDGVIGAQFQVDANVSGTGVVEDFENVHLYAW